MSRTWTDQQRIDFAEEVAAMLRAIPLLEENIQIGVRNISRPPMDKERLYWHLLGIARIGAQHALAVERGIDPENLRLDDET